MDIKTNIELVDTTKIKTTRELALYILSVADHNDWTDGYVLDCIIDTCHKILGDKK